MCVIYLFEGQLCKEVQYMYDTVLPDKRCMYIKMV